MEKGVINTNKIHNFRCRQRVTQNDHYWDISFLQTTGSGSFSRCKSCLQM